MISYGIILLIIGVIVWGVGAILAPRPPSRIIVVVGEVIAAIGAILLIVGLVLLLVHGGAPQLHVDSMGLLIG